MNIDRAKFFSCYRAEFGKLNQSQVDNIELWLSEAEKETRITDINQFAYILATVHHETAHTFRPDIKEYGRGGSRPYNKPAGPYGHHYYGRGPVQLTWLTNYRKQSNKLNVDFVQFPDKVMEMPYAWQILVYGMLDGDFTGKRLSQYVNDVETDYVRARMVVNGRDKASQIAKFARKFERCLAQSTT